ncbi:S-layer homology domain-containing protein [Paenibacillus periandrae]|uniref:S-layer homology domain-containing protein n=1 Tax=Paenibacillus periandrae TaxID=1761741 RepID=UPI001F08AE65|nr:S-layer homology domain-containing protein [Paenibacillus periandrae]
MKLIKSFKMVTLLASITAFVPLTSTHAVAAVSFTDTNGHWAESDIRLAVAKGYVDGYVDETFKPNNSITRAEFVKMLVTGLAFQTDPANSEYWHSKFLASAQANGLITKDETGSDSDLNRNILRDEMAKIAVRGTGATTNEENKWMYLATSKGIITGLNESGELGIDKPTTRAEAITVIERILKIKSGTVLPADKYATSEAEIAWHRTNVYSMAPEYFGSAKKYNGVPREQVFPWDEIRYESKLGMSEVEKYIVIDMDDPRDPNKKYLQDNMRWNKAVGKTRTPVAEIPSNSYVFLSFNHVVRYETPKTQSFDMSYLHLLSFKNGNEDSVDGEGNLINIAGFVPYVNDGLGYYYQAGNISFEEGDSEARLITGQIAPKNPLLTTDRSTGIYKSNARSLGEQNGVGIYDSVFDASLGGK